MTIMTKLLVASAIIATLLFSSCTSMSTREFTAIAKSELTTEMLENAGRLPAISSGVEENVVYGKGGVTKTITYEDVSNAYGLATNENSNNNVNLKKEVDKSMKSDYCVVTYSGNITNTYNTLTTTDYKYRIRECQNVSVGMDKLKAEVEEYSYWKTLLLSLGIGAGIGIISGLAAQR